MFVFSQEQLKQLLQIEDGWRGQNLLDLGSGRERESIDWYMYYSKRFLNSNRREREREREILIHYLYNLFIQTWFLIFNITGYMYLGYCLYCSQVQEMVR